jgi:CubicO group peptidase (beta-lactamase class C family)
MRRRHLFLLATPVLLGVLLLLARLIAGPLLRPALGFAAKVTCSGVFVGGATIEQVRVGFPDPTLRRIVRVSVDRSAGIADARVPLLGHRRAVHRTGLGCTLEPVGGEITALPDPPRLRAGEAGAALPWPDGDAAMAPPAPWDASRLAAVLDSAFRDAEVGPAARTHAVVVVQGGRIIAERYADGYSARHPFPGWSMAKSVTSALAGILTGDGTLDLGTSALRPEWRAPDDPRSRITLHHLMQMSSGLDFDESYTPGGGATRMLFDSPDAAAAAATSPLAHEPGRHWLYSSGTTNIIAAHLRGLMRDDAEWVGFPARRLFGPIGMTSAVLEPDPAGTFVGSSFMYATARDWARFGLLYLHDGVWNGERVLPEGWVEYSLTPAPAAPLGQYGAQWWLNAGEPADSTRRRWPHLPRDLYWASGFQGQYVVVLPSHDMVIVRLGMMERDDAWRLDRFLRSVLDAAADSLGDTVASPNREGP